MCLTHNKSPEKKNCKCYSNDPLPFPIICLIIHFLDFGSKTKKRKKTTSEYDILYTNQLSIDSFHSCKLYNEIRYLPYKNLTIITGFFLLVDEDGSFNQMKFKRIVSIKILTVSEIL